jgi:purine-binding chemotaxis protein CheW
MAEPDQTSPELHGAASRFLAFRSSGQLYAVPAQEVSEVILVPPVTRVPQAPRSLLGVANLRGAVLPLVSLRALLGHEEADISSARRAIVLEGAARVALAVDAVEALHTVESNRVERRQADLAAAPGERLQGAFQPGPHADAIKILDLGALLSAAFLQRPRPERHVQGNVIGRASLHADEETAAHQRILTFDIAGQEFALGLDMVREILPTPEARAAVPHADPVVLGITSYRDSLLPLLSLRGLLGFAPAAQSSGRERVIVTALGGIVVGLVADRMRSIIAADPNLVDPIPSVLAARTGGEARIKAIYRGEAGRRIISILAPEQLFREDVMQRLNAQHGGSRDRSETDQAQGADLQFLVFRLGDDEFALPIEAVDQVGRVPDKITRVPKTPAFLEGVVNLRGEVLPIVDQRRRFGMPELAGGEGRRLVVVRSERHRAGLIVDSVSEVLRSSPDAVGPAPDLTGEKTQLVHGVINLERAGRIVLVLDPSELLSRAERGLLDAFEAVAGQAGL